METRGIVEIGAAAVFSGGVAVGTLWVVAGAIDWPLVVGLTVGVAIAAAANYRARTGHAESVAEKAPDVTVDGYDEHARPAAGDGGTERSDGDIHREDGSGRRDASDGRRDER